MFTPAASSNETEIQFRKPALKRLEIFHGLVQIEHGRRGIPAARINVASVCSLSPSQPSTPLHVDHRRQVADVAVDDAETAR